MTAIIKNKFRLKNAKNFIESFEIPKNSNDILDMLTNADSLMSVEEKSTLRDVLSRTPNRNHYLFIGKPFGWDNTATPANTNSNRELKPPAPVDTQNEDERVWDEMLGLKQITRVDASLVIPRSDWRPNTVYVPFDDSDVELYRHPTATAISEQTPTKRAGNFYALNNMMELFICVDNNNGSVSTFQPSRLEMSGANSNISGRVKYPDGYSWQYITTISANEAIRFLTDSWIPVKTLPQDSNLNIPQEDVQANAIPGELLRVKITPPKSNLDTFYSYVGGKVQKTGNNNEVTIVLASGLPAPRFDVDAYKGYQLIVKQPNSDTGQVVAKYTITNYSFNAVTNWPLLTLSSSTSNLTLNTEYPCEILPLINVETNGEPTIDVRPVLNGAGKITSVKILNPGSKASTVKMSVNLPFGFSSENLPTLTPVLSPPAGLGRDPESDLGAFFVMLSTQLKYDEGMGDFPTANDYRQIGIIRDVKKMIKDSQGNDVVVLANEPTLNATKVVNVSFSSREKLGEQERAFESDDVIDIKISSNLAAGVVGKAKVVQFLRNPEVAGLISGKLFLVQNRETGYYPIADGQTYSVSTRSDVEAVTYSPEPSTPSVSKEEFLKFNGDILYLENRRAVLRSIDQIEDIKTIIEF